MPKREITNPTCSMQLPERMRGPEICFVVEMLKPKPNWIVFYILVCICHVYLEQTSSKKFFYWKFASSSFYILVCGLELFTLFTLQINRGCVWSDTKHPVNKCATISPVHVVLDVGLAVVVGLVFLGRHVDDGAHHLLTLGRRTLTHGQLPPFGEAKVGDLHRGPGATLLLLT